MAVDHVSENQQLFLSVLFLKAILRSQGIFLLSNKLKISKLGEALFNHAKKKLIFFNDNTEMIQGLKQI